MRIEKKSEKNHFGKEEFLRNWSVVSITEIHDERLVKLQQFFYVFRKSGSARIFRSEKNQNLSDADPTGAVFVSWKKKSLKLKTDVMDCRFGP